MKTIRILALLALIALATLSDAIRTSPVQQDSVTTITELQSWTLSSSNPASKIQNVSVRAPCTIIGGLLDAGFYGEAFAQDRQAIFFGKNLTTVINERGFKVPFVFTTTFTVGTTASTKLVLLRLLGINYAADVELDGVPLTNNGNKTIIGALRQFNVDITQIVAPTPASFQHTLKITIYPPLHTWTTDLAMSFLDWSPFPVDKNAGLWQPIQVITVSNPDSDKTPFTADWLVVNTQLPPSPEGRTQEAFVNVSFTLLFPTALQQLPSLDSLVLDFNCNGNAAGASKLPRNLTLRSPTCTPVGGRADHMASECRVEVSWMDHPELVIADPPLWWPWQLGEPTLFQMCVKASNDSSSVLLKTSYGLRQVTSDLTQAGGRRFLVNGVPLQIRGGGWAPDLFLRWSNPQGSPASTPSHSRMWQEMELVRKMNLNAVRLEGKPEYTAMFDAANELGLLVIMGIECCTAWQQWPTWTAPMYTIAKESIRSQVRRLSHNPSVFTFFASSDELPPPRVEQMYLDVFAAERWPNPVVSSASQQQSTITGPSGVKMTGPYSWVPPTYWLLDTNGLAHNDTRNYGGPFGFLTEGGPGEAPLTFGSWNRTVPAEHLWEPNAVQGGNANASMSTWWNAHMGNPLGRFADLQFFTPAQNARYGVSKSAEEFCGIGQASNYESIRAMFEGWSRQKHVNGTGVIQWMMNNAFPEHLWHLFDSYLVGGGGFYGAMRALEPVHVQMNPNNGNATLVLNTADDILAPIHIRVEVIAVFSSRSPVTQNLTQYAGQFVLPAAPGMGVVELAQLALDLPAIRSAVSGSQPGSFLVRYEWTTSGGVKENTYWLSTTSDVLDWPASNGFRTPCSNYADFSALRRIPAADLAITATSTSSCQIEVDIAPSSLAFFVQLRLVDATTGRDISGAIFSDNYFTMTGSSAARKITVTVAGPRPNMCGIPADVPLGITAETYTGWSRSPSITPVRQRK